MKTWDKTDEKEIMRNYVSEQQKYKKEHYDRTEKKVRKGDW